MKKRKHSGPWGKWIGTCSCRFSEGPILAIVYCPLHESAGELLEAAKNLLVTIDSGISYVEQKALKQAIAKAERGSK